MNSHTAASFDHLSYPNQNLEQEAPHNPERSSSRDVLTDRLYIGNIHPSVEEYTLLQIFSKFGKVTKLDYLFHKTGPLKGKPRGYAFVEYGNHTDAINALTMANDKVLRGRKLAVTHAHQAPLDQHGNIGTKTRKTLMDTGKPTALSMLKSVRTRGDDGTGSKIALMEEKLRQMERTDPNATFNSPYCPSPHHSLPARPVSAGEISSGSTGARMSQPSPLQLPAFPISLPSAAPLPLTALKTDVRASASPRIAQKSKLSGIKFGKPRTS